MRYLLTGLAAAVAVWGGAPALATAAAEGDPTFTKDVAPILYENCVRCHRRGEVAPMALVTYADARPWARSIKAKVESREMPPWFADPAIGTFRNDARLSQEQVDTIVAWADAGAPRGNEADLPPAPEFASGWLHPDGTAPDFVIEMSVDYEAPEAGEIPMTNFYTAVPFKEDRFVKATQVVPGNRRVVHHGVINAELLDAEDEVVNGRLINARTGRERRVEAEAGTNAAVDEEAERARVARRVFDGSRSVWLGTYAPGWLFEEYREGVGKRVSAGWHVVFNMHYQPTGRPETDRTSIGFWSQDALEKELVTQRVGETHITEGAELIATADGIPLDEQTRRDEVALFPTIPPHADNWRITAISAVTSPITIYSLSPHMHLRGKDMAFVAVYPDGREEVLISVPNYDFNWQLFYELEEPIQLPAGSKLMTVGHYDNSIGNRWNPAPEKEVYWAEQSWDEMFNGFIQYTIDETPATGPTE